MEAEKIRTKFRKEEKEWFYASNRDGSFTDKYVHWLESQIEETKEKIKEAYTDGFSDSRYDFDIENYIE